MFDKPRARRELGGFWARVDVLLAERFSHRPSDDSRIY